MDIKTIFLNGDLHEDVVFMFMTPPEGFKSKGQ